jgi:hypothetical protein
VTETSGDYNRTWWTLTTDFCYVLNTDYWQGPVYNSKYLIHEAKILELMLMCGCRLPDAAL